MFGFSVARGAELEDGAFDNTLAVTAAGENNWHMRNGEERYEVTEQYVMMQYEPIKDVRVKTVIVPLRLGHVRIHFIQSGIDAEYADSGFAIRTECEGQELRQEMVRLTEDAVKCVLPWGNAGAVCMAGNGKPRLVRPFPNTNIMYGSTVIPTIYYHLRAGTYCAADFFYGDDCSVGAGRDIVPPQIIWKENAVEIMYGEEKIVIEELKTAE